DLQAYSLSRNGEVVRLERIPPEVLYLLIERAGQVVARDEILERIWGKGVYIDGENAINTAGDKICRALNDDSHRAPLLVTLPGKGYGFVGPVLIPNGELNPGLVPNGRLNGDEKGQPPINGADFPFTLATSTENQSSGRRYWLAGLLTVAGLGLIASAMA